MNKRQKGNICQNKAAEFLTKWGYQVHNQKSVASMIRTSRGMIWVSKRNDILGCIDLIAIKSDEPTRFIQVTAHTGMGEKLKKLGTVKWNFAYSSVEVWRYVDKGRWVLMEYTGEALEKFAEIKRGVLMTIQEEVK